MQYPGRPGEGSIQAKQENASWRKGIWASVSDSLEVTGAKLRGDPGNQIEVAVIKATRADEEVPKEKHVRTLKLACPASADREQVNFVLNNLSQRMEGNKDSWVVTLKCLIVIHRLFREVDNSFQDYMIKWIVKTNNRKMIRLESFADQTTKETWDHSAWIRVYSVYLDERLEMFRLMNFDPENDAEGVRVMASLKTCPTDTLLERLPLAHRLLSRLIACIPLGKSTSNEIIVQSCGLVLREVRGVYRLVCEGMMNLADKFFEMSRNDAVRSLEMYRENIAINERLNSFFNQINGIGSMKGSVQFPTLQSLPADFATSMEEYIKDAPRELDAGSVIPPAAVVTHGVLKLGPAIIDAPTTSAHPPPLAAPVVAKAPDFVDLLGSDFSALSPPSTTPPPAAGVPNANPWGAPPPPPAPIPSPTNPWGVAPPAPPPPAPVPSNPWGAPPPLPPPSPLGGFGGDHAFGASAPPAPPAPPASANPWAPAAPPPPANPFQAPPPAYAPPAYGQQSMAPPPSYPTAQAPVASNPFGVPTPMHAPPPYGGAVPSPYAQPTPAYSHPPVAQPPAHQYASAVAPANGFSSSNPFGTSSAPAPSPQPQPWSQHNDPLGNLAIDLGFMAKPAAPAPAPMRPPPGYQPPPPGPPGGSFI